MSPSLRAIGARARPQAARAFLIAGAVVTGTGLLVAACAGPTTQSAGANHAAAPMARRPLAAPATAQGAAGTGAVYAPSDNAALRVTSGRLTRIVLPAQSIIYTAFLTARVRNGATVTGQEAQAANIVMAAGGYIAGEQETIPPGKHSTPQVNIQLKIPVAQYFPTLAKLKTLGKPVAFSQHSQDVTQQVADVNSRVASAQLAITQLRALLRRAGSVSQLLSVQEEINSQESNLEALLAQQRALAHETSYATVTVVLIGHHAKVVKKHKKIPGFTGGLRGGWHAFGVTVGWLLTALGSALPFAILVALIGGLVYGNRRRLVRRKAPPAASPPAAEAP